LLALAIAIVIIQAKICEKHHQLSLIG